MVAATIGYLKEHEPRAVVLVVGAHHLRNIASLLKANGLGLVAGNLKANGRDLQPWEDAAWRRRKRDQDRLYSLKEKSLKELSRLLNPVWKQEQSARFDVFRRIGQASREPLVPTVKGLSTDGAVYENVLPGRALAVHVSRFTPDRNADYGRTSSTSGPTRRHPAATS